MIKKSLAVLVFGFFIASCATDPQPVEESQLVVYVVDYGSNRFEAGTVLNFEKVNISFTSLEVDIDEDPIENGNDGAISLIYEPTGDKIFEGALTLEGNARINYPGMAAADGFFEIENRVTINLSGVEDIGGPYDEPFGPIWGAVDQLGLSEVFVNNNAMIGRFLYKPIESSNINWKWIILLFDQ